MAKLNGILKIEGTLQDMTFYKSQDGHLVRTKGGVSGQRIANDPAFIRTKENGDEFGAAASSGKLLRDTVRNLVGSASDNRVTARITQLMTQIKNLDDTSPRGKRVVGVGITKAEAKALLKGFNFNANSLLGAILYKPYTANTTTGVIAIADFVPANDLRIVSGATHVSFQGAMAVIDFAAGTSDIEFTNEEILAVDAASSTVTLTPAAVPTGTGTKMLFLTIEYFQEVNGFQYSLNNGAYNALAIIEVA